jgi:hypothetical protein
MAGTVAEARNFGAVANGSKSIQGKSIHGGADLLRAGGKCAA